MMSLISMATSEKKCPDSFRSTTLFPIRYQGMLYSVPSTKDSLSVSGRGAMPAFINAYWMLSVSGLIVNKNGQFNDLLPRSCG